ncbi:MAG: hypothetical protein ACFFAL_09740 [Promethearchaeota archaeon]
MFSRRQRGWMIGLVFLALIIVILVFPYLLIGTPVAVLFLDIELTVLVVMFVGVFFLLGLILYLGN